jgi:hypothetical protein
MTVLPGSCYYQISHPSGTWSQCFSLSGYKSAPDKVIFQGIESKQVLENVLRNEVVKYSEPPAEILEQYNKLKQR